MKFYFAPMEGINGYIYRNAYKDFFGGIDKYFMPFISTNQHGKFKTRDIKDVMPENNMGINAVPQILTNNSAQFVEASKILKDMGYDEINLNLGCPSGTVTAKGKGSGFLGRTDELDSFLYDIFSEGITDISIKTRLGIEKAEEFSKLMEIYNKYPLKELIIHPRVQKDFYDNVPNMKAFKEAFKMSRNPVCYNGDIFTSDDYKRFIKEVPDEDRVMLGRGLIMNPALMLEIREGKKLNIGTLKEFHDRLCSDYENALSGERNVILRMKPLWFYMASIFPDSEKEIRKIRKSQSLKEYKATAHMLFNRFI